VKGVSVAGQMPPTPEMCMAILGWVAEARSMQENWKRLQ
jgi:hypothetical protein